MEFFQLKKRSLIICILYLLLSNFSFSQVIRDAVGEGTYTVPANVCAIYVEVIGAGGGGGYASENGQTTGGGGGGAYAAKKFYVSPGQVINYRIGQGGLGSPGTNNGGDTWFFNSSSLLAQGGRGASDNNTAGGLGGSLNNSIGDVRFSGGNGGTGSGGGECHASGGGGSSAGPGANGRNGANAQAGNPAWLCSGKTAGVGGQPVADSWNQGVGGLGATNTIAGTGSEGFSGTGYGSGGGGAKKSNATFFGDAWRVKNGGNGTNGALRITVYYQHTVNISGLTALCEGTATTLTAAANQSVSYAWNVGGTGSTKEVSPVSTTTYTVTSTSASTGCTNTATHTINVTPKWSLPISVIGEGEYCVGNTVNLALEGGHPSAIYEWLENDCNGTSFNSLATYSYEPTVSQTFYVRTAAHGACAASACLPITVTVNEAGNNLSVDLDESTCPVRDNNWVHFYNNGRLLLSVNSFGQNLGKVRAVSYVDPTSQLVAPCGHEDNELYSTSVMNRHWAVYPEVEPTNPIQVRLPFYTTDLTNLISSSQSNANPDDNIIAIGGVVLSKYHGPNNVNGQFDDNCISTGGNEGTTSHGQAGNGLVSTYSSIPNAQYTQFTINELSELWLHGSDKMTPLGILIDQIIVDCGTNPIVKFRADRVSDVERIEVKGSLNGDIWGLINTFENVDLNFNGSQVLSVADMSAKNYKYYSVEAFDFANESIVNKIVVSTCALSINDLQLYPNPSTGEILLDWNSESIEATMVVLSIEGKVVEKMPISQKQKVSLHHLAKGTYWIQVILPNGEESVQRLILQ